MFSCGVGTVVNPTLQMGELRHFQEVKPHHSWEATQSWSSGLGAAAVAGAGVGTPQP